MTEIKQQKIKDMRKKNVKKLDVKLKRKDIKLTRKEK